jgi:hypothetical protein
MSELDAERLAQALAAELHIDEAHGFPRGFTVQELAVHVAAEYSRLETGIGPVDIVAGALKGTYAAEFGHAEDDDWRSDAEFVLARFQEYGWRLVRADSAAPGKPVMSVAMSDADEGPA